MHNNQTVDLTPQVVNLKLTRGDSWTLPFEFEDTDLTGYTFAAQIRKSADDSSAVSLTIAETDLTVGKFEVGQEAASLSGYWDLQLTSPGGLPRTYAKGWVEVEKDITHD